MLLEMDGPKKEAPISDKGWQQVMSCLKTVEYGTVTLIIQNSKVIRIEKVEKMKVE